MRYRYIARNRRAKQRTFLNLDEALQFVRKNFGQFTSFDLRIPKPRKSLQVRVYDRSRVPVEMWVGDIYREQD